MNIYKTIIRILLFILLLVSCDTKINKITKKTNEKSVKDVPSPPESHEEEEISPSDEPAPSPEEQIEAYIRQLVHNKIGKGAGQFPSLVIGYHTGKTQKTLYFGTAKNRSAPNENTVYPISSISKMFIGLLTAKAVLGKKIKQSDFIVDYLPNDLKGQLSEQRIGMVVSHYGGFKSMPTNLVSNNPIEPAMGYSQTDLARCLRQPRCFFSGKKPGTSYLYSNLGLGLLGLAIQNVYQVDNLEDLLNTQFKSMINMSNTHADSSYYTNILDGYTQQNEIVQPSEMGILGSAGSIHSTPKDMATLLNFLIFPSTAFQKVVSLVSAPIKPGLTTGYSVDIKNINGMELFGKSGDQAGYSSLLLWSKRDQNGTFALSSRGMSSKQLADILLKIQERMQSY